MNAEKRLATIIATLPAKEKAVLIMRHLADGNQTEADSVTATIPIKHYAMPDQETMRTLSVMGFGLLFWAMEHQRYMSGHYLCLWGATSALWRRDLRGADEMVGQLMIVQGRLMSLDRALKSFCARTGLDVSVAARLTGATPFSEMPKQILEAVADENGLDADELRKNVGVEAFSILMPEVTVDQGYLEHVEKVMGGDWI